MKLIKNIWNVIKGDLQLYVFILFVVVLPFTKKYLPHITFAWVVSATFSIRKITLKSFKNSILLIFPIIFYLTHIIGLFYSEDIGNGIFNLEKKLSILFIPLVVLFITKKVEINYRLILKVFVYANFVASIVCLIYALYQSTGINELSNWYFEPSHWPSVTQGFSFVKLINYRYSNFSYGFLSIFHHPTYFSVYILFSITILIYLIRSSQNKKNIGYFCLIIYFSVFIWLLGSRAAYITYLLGLISFFVILMFKYKKYWIGIAAIVMSLLVSSVILSNKQFNRNVKEIINLSEGKSLNQDSDIRLILWKSGYEIFKDNLWFGVGIGDMDKEMSLKQEEENLDIENQDIHNPHNQYLTIAVKLGIVGLFVFIGWIATVFYITLKRKQFLFFYFMLIMAINLLFESMLNLIAGIGFFVFFYSLLYIIYNQDTDKSHRLLLF